jgi:hypothetical protein
VCEFCTSGFTGTATATCSNQNQRFTHLLHRVQLSQGGYDGLLVDSATRTQLLGKERRAGPAQGAQHGCTALDLHCVDCQCAASRRAMSNSQVQMPNYTPHAPWKYSADTKHIDLLPTLQQTRVSPVQVQAGLLTHYALRRYAVVELSS